MELSIPCRFIINGLSLLIVTSFVVFFRLNLLPASDSGFFCGDPSIRLPYRNELFPTWVLIAVTTFVPILFIILVDFSTSGRRAWKMTAINSAHVSIVYLFGCAATVALTDMGKSLVSRPRPHFLAVCRPNVTCLEGVNVFVEKYVCTGDNPKDIEKSMRSFPSGHASVAAYVAVFLSFYFQAKLRSSYGTLLRPVLQLILFAFAWGSGLSRVADYRHHLSDVFAGFALGVFIAIIIIRGGMMHLFPSLAEGVASQSVPTLESSCPSNRDSRVSTFSSKTKAWNETETRNVSRLVETNT